jgi:hypothetical protein
VAFNGELLARVADTKTDRIVPQRLDLEWFDELTNESSAKRLFNFSFGKDQAVQVGR